MPNLPVNRLEDIPDEGGTTHSPELSGFFAVLYKETHDCVARVHPDEIKVAVG